MTSRRDFLLVSAAVAGYAAMPSALRTAAVPAKIAQPGMQLYTLNAEMAKDMPATLAMVKEIGFNKVEFASYFRNPPEKLKEALDANKLIAPSAHVGLNQMETNFPVAEAAAKILGHDTLVVASIDRRLFTTVEQWKGLAARFNELGRKTRGAGMRFAYHNHDYEFIEVEGTRGYDVLVGETDPALVDFELDIYWIVKGGGDPVAYFAKYPGRFPIVHVKDTDGAPAFKMLDPGKGIIDFKRIFAKEKQAGIKHYYAEVDNPADAKATMQASFKYLSEIEF